jgi:oligopeptide/dipeptide ABC transporter ATP-binding protein
VTGSVPGDTGSPTAAPLLVVEGLRTVFSTELGEVVAADDVSFDVREREVFALVGESGSGKTVTALSILGLLPKPAGRITAGRILYRGEDLRTAPPERQREVRGAKISMIFQDPLTALNPVHRVGHQVAEVIRAHKEIGKAQAFDAAIELLDRVGIPRARERARDYPHAFSGGMRQRVMIAMAIAMGPDLIIADEPTTALDVTIQAQIIDVLEQVRDEFQTAIMLITHDLGVVAGVADRVMVMYAGRMIERGTTRDIFYRPQHPYTWGLLGSVPRLDRDAERLVAIPGRPPDLLHVPMGCAFQPRCAFAFDRCVLERPELIQVRDHEDACFLTPEQKDAGRAEVLAR